MVSLVVANLVLVRMKDQEQVVLLLVMLQHLVDHMVDHVVVLVPIILPLHLLNVVMVRTLMALYMRILLVVVEGLEDRYIQEPY